MNEKRVSWDRYFMDFAVLSSARSTCVRRGVGACIIRNNRIISTGYNGVPIGVEHCTKETCVRNLENVPSGERHELCMGLHAEQNAILSVINNNINMTGATLYCTHQPCIICLKMIINSGINKVVYLEKYEDELRDRLVEASNVEVVQFKEG